MICDCCGNDLNPETSIDFFDGTDTWKLCPLCKPKRPVGRPAGTTKPDSRHRKCTILLNEKEFCNLARRASDAGMTVSAYLRHVAKI